MPSDGWSMVLPNIRQANITHAICPPLMLSDTLPPLVTHVAPLFMLLTCTSPPLTTHTYAPPSSINHDPYAHPPPYAHPTCPKAPLWAMWAPCGEASTCPFFCPVT